MNIFFIKRRGLVQTPAKPRFIEIEIEKSRFLIEKKSTPSYPEICYVVPRPKPAAVHIDAPPNAQQFRKKKCAGTASSCDFFCEKKSETVTKHRVNQSKITLFRLAIPKMAVFFCFFFFLVFFVFFLKKKWNFGVFWGLGAFPASEFC